MIRIELRRAFFSKLFLLTCGITFVMLVIGGVDYIKYTIFHWFLTSWWEIYIVSLVFGMTSLLALFYPLVVMIPYVLSYRRERDSGYRQLILLKTSRKVYLRAKILAVAGSAFTALLLPNLCWIMVCRFALGQVDPAYDRIRDSIIDFALPFYDNHPGLYVIMYVVLVSVLGAIFAVLGLGLSAVIKNRYLALLLPFVYCIFSSSILASAFDNSFAALDLLSIQLCRFGILGYWVIPIYGTVLGVVGLALFLGGDYYASKA